MSINYQIPQEINFFIRNGGLLILYIGHSQPSALLIPLLPANLVLGQKDHSNRQISTKLVSMSEILCLIGSKTCLLISFYKKFIFCVLGGVFIVKVSCFVLVEVFTYF